ncbi:hypothetical protein SPADD19_00897 [Streptococcus parasanguinis]|uniref:hypothetical protein n=1 Tax=Streptococcus parasanguinis TaxID=1318 RepID=UPI0007773AFA|nr:hypothetical protein [Streptococcus parasanguinis]KXT88455.1 hypothetical protein SPADD19_00897 [Streptococcus parasanguinis]
MKKTEKFIVIRNKENGYFLQEYENNNRALAYSSKWTDDLRDAANNSVESIEKQGDRMYKVAEAFEGELLEVTATYELKTLDGKEPKDLTEEIKEAKRKHFENFLRGLLSDNDEED